MDWLDEDWYALDERQVQVVDCGKLTVPTGNLLICDPICYLDSDDSTMGCRIKITAGEYPVKLSCEGRQVAYASLILSERAEAVRKQLKDMPEAVMAENVDDEEIVTFPVDAGVAGFVDEGALIYGMPPDKKLWGKQVINFQGVHQRFIDKMRMRDMPLWSFDAPPLTDSEKEEREKAAKDFREKALAEAEREARESVDTESIAYLPGDEHWNLLFEKNDRPFVNTKLPLASDGANIIMTDKFGGDGHFPVVGGYDADGNLVAVHVAFYDPRWVDDEDDDLD